jgi:hypothetical protein
MSSKSPNRVAYQGVPGAYSEMAARKACPDCEPLPCDQFEVAFQVGCMGVCGSAWECMGVHGVCMGLCVCMGVCLCG